MVHRRPTSRARAVAVGLSLLAATVLAGKDPEGSETVFALVLTFEQDFSRLALNSMQRELENILSPFDLRFEWRLGLQDRREQMANLLVSVRLRGSCTIEPSERPVDSLPLRVLGQTEISDGKLLSYCAVNCDEVRTIIQSAVNNEAFVQMQTRLGQALGRVLAHELYHILAATTRHRSSGISKRVVTPEDLVDGVMRLEAEEVEAIRRQIFRGHRVADSAADGRE